MGEDKPEVETHGVEAQSNETVVEDEPEVEAHGTEAQSNETVVEDDEVEAHGVEAQSNETVVDDGDEQKLEDLEVTDEKADAVKGGMSEMGETGSLRR